MGYKRQVAVLATATLLVGLAAPAFAEGSFTSSLSNVGVGFESRDWTDNDTDATNGYVKITGCTHAITVGVYHNVIGPDEAKALGATCDTAVYFGDVGKGDYHFTVKSIGGGASTVSASSVKVVY